MFDDFEDPFGLPMEELELAPAPRATPEKRRGPAYSEEEVRTLAGFGEGGDIAKDAPYALRTRGRVDGLRADFEKRRLELDAALQTCDEELRLLAAKLTTDGALERPGPPSPADDADWAVEVLHTGKAGAILAAPSLGAFTHARAVSRDAALTAAALNAVDDGAYRRGAELVAVLVILPLISAAVLLLL